MAKGTLTFDLPEEQTEFDMANRAADMWAVLDDLDQELRNHFKWETHPDWDDKTVEEVRQILLDAMMERGINFK